MIADIKMHRRASTNRARPSNGNTQTKQISPNKKEKLSSGLVLYGVEITITLFAI